MKTIKEKLSHLLPPSKYAFYETQNAWQSHVQRLGGTLEELKHESASATVKLDAVIGRVSYLHQKDFPCDVRFEREYYKDFPTWTSPCAPEFQTDFLKLIDSLDEKSVETVVVALQRMQRIKASADDFMDFFSEEEIRSIRYLAEHFYSNVLALSENCYFYRGYLLPINHFESCVFVDKCGLPWIEHPERLANGDVIDAGAFIGDSALIFSSITKGKIHAFEPEPSNYNLMLKTLEMNGISNVIPRPCALGEKRGTTTINVNSSSSTQVKNQAFEYKGSVDVDVMTIDDYVKEHNLHIGLIKADVEGAEQLMLQGAMETICTQKPTLLISIYHNGSDFFKIKPMLEKLNLGYTFKIRHSVFGSVLTETILIAEMP